MCLKINSSVIFKDSGISKTYFHPKATVFKDNKTSALMMTLQTISGSDYFGPVEASYSFDNGASWNAPELIPSLGYNPVEDGVVEGVCDIVPDYHEKSGKVLAIGHNVYCKGDGFFDTYNLDKNKKFPRYSVYSVRDQDGNWSERKRIYLDEFKDYSFFVCGCTQKIFLPDGKIIISFSILDGKDGRRDRMVCSLLCDFDGDEIKVLKCGNMLELPVKRGLGEASMIEFQGKYYITLRAEDDHGYLSVADDGLHWDAIKSWQWEDGSCVTMSSTQQHWLKLGGKLYLVYTRQDGNNDKVIRWRSPLFIAEFDTENICLKKDSEQILLPIRGDLAQADTVALMGNFHPLALSETEAIVTVGEMRPRMKFSGEVLLAHLAL
jgi:hypothetical protein